MSQFLYLKKTSIPSWVTVDQRILRLHWLRRTLLNTQTAQDNKKPNNNLSFYVIFIEMLIISFYRLTLLQKLLQILFLRFFWTWLAKYVLPTTLPLIFFSVCFALSKCLPACQKWKWSVSIFRKYYHISASVALI